jgi:hypothetical protein
MLNKEDQKKICKAVKVDFEKFQQAVDKNDAGVLNDVLTTVKNWHEKHVKEEKAQQQAELMKLAAVFITEIKKNLEKIQRAETKDKFNSKKSNKQSSDIGKLKTKIEDYFKANKIDATCKPLENDKSPNEQLISNENQKMSKQGMKVTFNDGTDTVLHVNNGRIFADKSQITEKTIPNIVETAKAMGLKEVNVNEAAFPKENGDELYKQLCEELINKDITVLGFQAEEKKQDKKIESPKMQ